MACEKRRRTGSCSHHQCEFKDQTEDGYQCVSVIGGFCEMGEDCIKECSHSFHGKKAIAEACRVFKEYAEA